MMGNIINLGWNNFKLMKIFFLITLLAGTLFLTAQERTVNVAFDNYDKDGYSFVTVTNDPNTAEYLYFTDIKDELIDKFGLKNDNTVGQQFTITYSISTKTTTNELGKEETKNIYTLLSIKKK
ncbi:MAG: hypothetical protein CR989_00370 [Flavobacteriales bacterium]|nr:MAG: hypothetical protein CR989_00370 [Flavobacteriales bacterium]